jgi:hypothetical protein
VVEEKGEGNSKEREGQRPRHEGGTCNIYLFSNKQPCLAKIWTGKMNLERRMHCGDHGGIVDAG